MSTDDSREQKLAAMNGYRTNRAGMYVQWLAWATGIVRRWAELKVDEEGARLGAAALISVIRQTSNEIFRAVLTDDLQERLTGHSVVISRGKSVSNLVTRLLAKKEEVTPDDLAEFGLESMDEAARDRLCETLNAVLFRPEVDLSPELRVTLQRDMIKALEAIGGTEQFKDVLKEAAKTGRYTALAELLDKQEAAPAPEAAESSFDGDSEPGTTDGGGELVALSVVHVAPSGRDGFDDDDPAPLAA